MAKKKRYIAQYRMPVAIDYPPANIPYANTPEELSLTEGEAAQLKRMLPDIKLIEAENSKDSAQAIMASAEAEQEKPKEEVAPEPEEEDISEPNPEPEEEESAGQEDQVEEEVVATHALADDADFPGEDKLQEHGFVTVEEVVQFKLDNDLTDISGIGSATADKITDHLMENYSDLLDE